MTEPIWEVLPSPASDAYTALFRPLPDGTLVDRDGGALTLPADGVVRLVHPLELDAATRERWQGCLARNGITPFMRQLDRPTYALPDELCTACVYQTAPIRRL